MFVMQNIKLMQGGVSHVFWINAQNVDRVFVSVSSQMINTFLKKFKAKIEKGNWISTLVYARKCEFLTPFLFVPCSLLQIFSWRYLLLKTVTTDCLCFTIFYCQLWIMLLSILLFCILFLVAGVTWVIMATRPRSLSAITVISNTWWNTS